MFSNVTRWNILEAAKNVSQIHDSDPPTGGLVEGLSGVVVGVALLIGIAIAVRKNLELIRGVLEQLQIILTPITNAVRKWVPTTPPPPPPNESTPQNFTDDEIIEMRRIREQMDQHLDRQTDQDASISVWI